jgi:hypothetical protein
LANHVLASSGYLELGMFDDAASVLEEIAPEDKTRNEVLGARVNLYMAAKKWDMAAAVATHLVNVDPGTAGWWISLAYFGPEPPDATGQNIPVWVRNEWNASQKNVVDAAAAAGTDSPILFVFVPKASPKRCRARWRAKSRSSMNTRLSDAERARDQLVTEITSGEKSSCILTSISQPWIQPPEYREHG